MSYGEIELNGEQHGQWESAFQHQSLKQKLLHMDLRPLILLVVLLGGLTVWLSVLYCWHHQDDRPGVTYGRYKTQDMLNMQANASTSE